MDKLANKFLCDFILSLTFASNIAMLVQFFINHKHGEPQIFCGIFIYLHLNSCFFYYRHDEWINISSPRLRPISACPTSVVTPTPPELASAQESVETPVHVSKDIKVEDKPKVQFIVGERCLARWRDNRRFIATIANSLGNGK